MIDASLNQSAPTRNLFLLIEFGQPLLHTIYFPLLRACAATLNNLIPVRRPLTGSGLTVSSLVRQSLFWRGFSSGGWRYPSFLARL